MAELIERGTPSSESLPACHVVANGVELEERHRALIRREARKLARFYRRILEVRVVITTPHRRLHREVVQYQVVVRVSVPLTELVVRRQVSPDLLTAVQNAFRAAGRVVQDYAVRHRAPPPVPEPAPLGRVASISPFEGFGFLIGSDGQELYFHRNSVLRGDFNHLEVGDRVRYAEENGERGPQASTVARVRRRR